MSQQTDLDALDALVGAASDGTWIVSVTMGGVSIRVDGMFGELAGFAQLRDANAAAALKNAYPALAAELREAWKRVRELEAEIEVRDNSANLVLDTLKAALPNRGFHSEMEAAEAAATELADLRAKLAAAEKEKASLRASVICAMHDIQHGLPATGHAKLTLLLDGIMRSPGNLAERLQAQLAAAREREAGLAALVERMRESIDRIMTGGNHLASALIGILGAGHDTFPPYSTDYEEASNVISDPNHRDLWMCWKIIMLQRDALASLTPPAALEALRRRETDLLAIIDSLMDKMRLIQQRTSAIGTDNELGICAIATCALEDTEPLAALEYLRERERSIGAEEELRRLAANTPVVNAERLWTHDQLLARADAIAAERDHIADAGKMAADRDGEGGSA